MDESTRPTDKTREAEREESRAAHDADRPPSEEEERLADENRVDEDAAEHAQEMYQRGANQKGEGRIP